MGLTCEQQEWKEVETVEFCECIEKITVNPGFCSSKSTSQGVIKTFQGRTKTESLLPTGSYYREFWKDVFEGW